MNTVLGGGYSARLNYEIRIKRGLSYGAGSTVTWRWNNSNFGTRAQTKNQSAAEVAELTLAEIKRLTDGAVPADELVPRKSTLTGNFGLGLETTAGLAKAVSDLYSFGVPTSELNSFVANVNGVTDAQISDFASKNLLGGDVVIAGDYSVFKDDLAKRFPNMKVEIIKADALDLSKDNLQK
jgi:zinc protease